VFTRLTVRENLGFALEAQGIHRRARGSAIDDIAARLSIASLLDRRGRDLNVSEAQRVAFARSVIARPRLLLLDEPMANLDSNLRAHLKGELRRIQRSLKQTVIYVTHDQSEALALSDRVAVMNDGELIQVGTPDEIYHRPLTRFVAEFVGEPQINTLPCTLRNQNGELIATTAAHTGLPIGAGAHPAGEYLLCVRPHRVHVAARPARGTAPGIVRFVENLGVEHVLHIEYGDELLRTLVAPGIAAVGQAVHVSFDLEQTLLIRRSTGTVLHVDRVKAEAV
jgi:sn-glycerol 3-phosphate transport system ATP-binding protein